MEVVEVRRTGRVDYLVRLKHSDREAAVTWCLRGSARLGAAGVKVVSVSVSTSGEPLDPSAYEALAGSAGFVEAEEALNKCFPPARRYPRLSDPPEFWLSERRGRNEPEDVHYAQLAIAYAAIKEGRQRRELPRRWAEAFGGSEKAWRHRLTKARQRYMLGDDGEPTLAALEEVYGPKVFEQDRAIDRALDALRIVKDGPTDAEKNRARRQGMTVAQYEEQARSMVKAVLGDRIPPREQAATRLREELGEEVSSGVVA